jgi:hypothetical protein
MLGPVFARLLGRLRQMVGSSAQPTLTVGPVCPVLTTPTGSPCSAATMCHQCQPASHPPLPSSEAVQPTSVEANSGSETPPVRQAKKSKAVGTKQATPAPRTRQPAKSAAKPKPKAVNQASSGKKTTRAKASAQTRTVKRSGASGT